MVQSCAGPQEGPSLSSHVVGLHSRASLHVKPWKGQLLDVSQLFILKLQVYSPAVALEFDVSTATGGRYVNVLMCSPTQKSIFPLDCDISPVNS